MEGTNILQIIRKEAPTKESFGRRLSLRPNFWLRPANSRDCVGARETDQVKPRFRNV